MKQGLVVGSVSLFALAIVVAGCGEEGGEPGPGSTAACCTGTQCTVVSQTACTSMDGVYKAGESSCGTSTCGAGQTGACFGQGNVCTMATRAQCQPPSEFGGEGSTCPQ